MIKRIRHFYAAMAGAMALVAIFYSNGIAQSLSPAGADSTLPGVNNDFQIVKPRKAVPEEESLAGKPGQFKVGDIDVRISGSVTVDVGVGSTRPQRR